MNPETGTFISMDSYAGSLDNPVSLHKYLYANANPVIYTDPTGYFSLAESSVAQGIQGVLNNVLAPMFNIKKMMSWANMAVTMYDIAQQFNMLMSGEATVMGLAKAIAKGMITQALLNCALTKVLGKAANTVVKLIGIAQDTESFIEAVKSGDPERIMVESLRLVVSLYTLKCECFTGETLVSTTEGEKRIDEIKIGDYVYAYDTEKEENVPAKVTYVSITETDILVHVYTSEGEEIKTTMFHPFYVKNVKNGEDETYGMWKASANLVAGDELLTEDGRVVYVEEVKVERLAESIKVYNLEVEGLHTYYVGSGVLVHNNYAKGNDSNGNSSSESGKVSTKTTRRQAFRQAKEAAGIPKSAQYTTHKFVYDGSSENRIVYEFNVSGEKKYIIEHPFDKMGRGNHFHGADASKGSPFNKGRYNQYEGHFPEDFDGFD